jgi:hypothetical protein
MEQALGMQAIEQVWEVPLEIQDMQQALGMQAIEQVWEVRRVDLQKAIDLGIELEMGAVLVLPKKFVS